MKILEIISSRRWIGEAAHVFNLTKILQRRGHKIILLCKRGWALSTRAKDEGIETVELEMNGHFNIKQNRKDISKIIKVIKNNDIDIIHCHRGNDHWLSMIALKLSGRKIPIVRTRHVNVPVKTHFFNRWLYKNTDDVICVSSHILEGYLEANIVPKGKLHLIYTGANLDDFKYTKNGHSIREEFNIEKDTPIVGIVGRIAAIKGQRYLVEAAPLIKRKFPKVKFILAGEEKSKRTKEKLEQLIKELKLEKDIIFTGYRKDIADIIAAFNVAVIASKGSEGSSRACYEYMAMKKPIVATSVGILPELLEDGKSGFIIPPKNSQMLSDAVCKLLGNKELSRRFGENAFKRLNEKFNFNKWIEKTEKVLIESVKKKLS